MYENKKWRRFWRRTVPFSRRKRYTWNILGEYTETCRRSGNTFEHFHSKSASTQKHGTLANLTTPKQGTLFELNCETRYTFWPHFRAWNTFPPQLRNRVRFSSSTPKHGTLFELNSETRYEFWPHFRNMEYFSTSTPRQGTPSTSTTKRVILFQNFAQRLQGSVTESAMLIFLFSGQ